jgi:predicted transcriptional regulator
MKCSKCATPITSGFYLSRYTKSGEHLPNAHVCGRCQEAVVDVLHDQGERVDVFAATFPEEVDWTLAEIAERERQRVARQVHSMADWGLFEEEKATV